MSQNTIVKSDQNQSYESVETLEHGTQDQWHGGLENLELLPKIEEQGLKTNFGEARYQVMERLVKAHVPHAEFEVLPLEMFIEDPAGMLACIESEKYHLFVEPIEQNAGRRLRFKHKTAEEIISIATALKNNLPDYKCFATLLESPDLLYHGNVLVYDQNSCSGLFDLRSQIIGEFVSGESVPVSRGINPEFRLWDDPYTGTFRYNFDSPKIRSLLYKSLQTIPRTKCEDGYDGFRERLLPGYYEIGIAKKPKELGCFAYIYDMKPWEGK